MKIATWNINSVRHRIALVARFLREKQPDVLCLQETKVTDDLFPGGPLAKLAKRPITGWRCSRACHSRRPVAKISAARAMPAIWA